MPLKTTAGTHGEVIKGRGSPINIEGRFEEWNREAPTTAGSRIP
jgi:hypothetical protein